ncbi:putative 50S ribosome-binding GTPase [Lyophyllum shimeji]|uniref:50S ribosome-binding GTPase n=1 Tax=Lyophyllum shimeji TaxID=47721 RepID=A0A9P3UNI1_LYOSH|nr:putative 50S ribosome-binding GTPase [Lyophyllum shimeji]
MAHSQQQSHNTVATDGYSEDGGKEDLVILVMGATGAGKSTFINTVLGQRDRMPVGRGLTSGTANIDYGVIKLSGRRVFMVDTPGFDDTYRSDVEILQQIADWLAGSYHRGLRDGNIIYLHDVSQDRLTAADRKSLQMVKHLCGNAAWAKVVLGTTKWDRFASEKERDKALKREEELKDKEWKSMIANGSQVHKFEGTPGSALRFINSFLHRYGTAPATILQIQQELAIDRKSFLKTRAGKFAAAHEPKPWWRTSCTIQ